MGTAGAPWKQILLNAMQCNSNRKNPTYFQLATIGHNGRPSNFFSGFQGNSDKIQINTDYRNRKIEELKQSPCDEESRFVHVGIFADSWEQFQINEIVDVIDESNPNPMKLQVDYLNLKSNERITFCQDVLKEISCGTPRVNP